MLAAGRTAMKAALVVLVALGATASTASAPRPDEPSAGRSPKRPNIVVVMADDLRVDDLQQMPYTRQLFATHGVRFRNAFAPNPLCCPDRATYLTGQTSHTHGVYSHLDPWGFQAFDDSFTLATALHQRGYRTAHVGKYLNGYGRQRSRVTGRPSLRYVPRGYTDWYSSVEPPAGSGLGGTYNYFHVTYNHNGTIDDAHRGQYSTDGIGAISRRLISTYAGGSAPFFLTVNFVAPHHGAPVEADDPPDLVTPARPTWVQGRFDRQLTRSPGLPRHGGPAEADMSDKPRFLRGRSDAGQAMRAQLLEVARQRAEAAYVMDRQVRRLVSHLRSTGEWADTVLVFASDNGFLLGEHRLRAVKEWGYEPSIRVPLLMTGPGIPRGQIRDDPATTQDLTATILQLAGARRAMAKHLAPEGVSLMRTVRTGDRGWVRPIVLESHLDGDAWFEVSLETAQAHGFRDTKRSYVGVRTARYVYLRYVRGGEELYDLATDANQLRSRHRDPSYRPLKRELVALWRQVKDCHAEECLTPLPLDLQVPPHELHQLTASYWQQVRRRYGG